MSLNFVYSVNEGSFDFLSDGPGDDLIDSTEYFVDDIGQNNFGSSSAYHTHFVELALGTNVSSIQSVNTYAIETAKLSLRDLLLTFETDTFVSQLLSIFPAPETPNETRAVDRRTAQGRKRLFIQLLSAADKRLGVTASVNQVLEALKMARAASKKKAPPLPPRTKSSVRYCILMIIHPGVL